MKTVYMVYCDWWEPTFCEFFYDKEVAEKRKEQLEKDESDLPEADKSIIKVKEIEIVGI